MNFHQALADLERRGIMPLRVPSLEPTRIGLQRLHLRFPDDPKRVILVAGTNGKGSTSKTLETLLRRAGRRTGLYVSPHLVNYRERISISGEPVSEKVFVRAWSAVAEKTQDLTLSHFEMLTLMAAWVFFSGEVGAPVDEAIFEVGLGGLWDATNAIPHGTCVICRLGLDHQEYLGGTLSEIARNKFGIVSQGSVVIHLPLQNELEELKKEFREATESVWIEAPAFGYDVDESERLPRFYLNSKWGRAEISLPGLRGAENMNLALQVFESLRYEPSQCMGALGEVVWPARMQKLDVPGALCPVYLSGDHNPQGIESLLEILEHYKRDRLLLVVGIGAKKDLGGILNPLSSLSRSRIWLTRAVFQGRAVGQYGEWIDKSEGFFENPLEALADALRGARPEDLCLITGSLYLAGDVLGLLEERGTEWNVFVGE